MITHRPILKFLKSKQILCSIDKNEEGLYVMTTSNINQPVIQEFMGLPAILEKLRDIMTDKERLEIQKILYEEM